MRPARKGWVSGPGDYRPGTESACKELAPGFWNLAGEGLASRIADTVREVTKLRAEVCLCAPGSLPNDGKVVTDERDYG